MGLHTVPNMKGKFRFAIKQDFLGRHYYRFRLLVQKYGMTLLITSIIGILIVALILK